MVAAYFIDFLRYFEVLAALFYQPVANLTLLATLSIAALLLGGQAFPYSGFFLIPIFWVRQTAARVPESGSWQTLSDLAIFFPVIIQTNSLQRMKWVDGVGIQDYTVQLVNCTVFQTAMKLKPRSSDGKSKPEPSSSDFQKTTTGDQEKRYRLVQKLISHNPESFREINIDDYDLNITESFDELDYIDDVVTPLIYCAHFGLKEIARHLLRNKRIDVDMETQNNKQTPLLVACMRGNYEIARLLVLAGAEVNKPNALNHTPLAAIIFRLAQEPPSFENNLMCFRLSEFLLDHGADINWIVDKSRGYTLLHYFCSVRMKMGKTQKDLNYSIIKFLLEKGADVSQRTLKDETVHQLLQKHCNKEDILVVVKEAEARQQENKKNSEKNKFSKIDENYFRLPPKGPNAS